MNLLMTELECPEMSLTCPEVYIMYTYVNTRVELTQLGTALQKIMGMYIITMYGWQDVKIQLQTSN